MANPKYLGRGQLAVCMRSGTKCFAHQLIHDGRNPALLVLPEWYDPPQAQEKPYSPSNTEGKARFPIAPDHIPKNPSVLTLADNNPVRLQWSTTQTAGPRVEAYQVYRALGSASFVLQQTYESTFGGAPQYTLTETLAHTDGTAVDGLTYRYRVDAVTSAGTVIRSNVLTVVAA